MDKTEVGRPIDILLVEDNPADVRLPVEALKEAKISNHLFVARDGREALNWLRGKEDFSDPLRPDIILLDLNLPKKDGREVLAEIKNDPQLKRIPVVVLTTSKAHEDIARSYDLHANCFITKPVDFDKFIEVVKSIEDFWLSVVKLPTS
jgi:two-component system, chemotaxis family, response regulator Rcp1